MREKACKANNLEIYSLKPEFFLMLAYFTAIGDSTS